MWKIGKNERFHDKKVYIQYADDGRSTALQIQCGASICPRKNETWVPDTKKGYGMKRADPIIRFFADTVVISGCHGCPDRYTLLFVSWNQKPSPEDHSYAQYLSDEKHSGFLGITSSGSAVQTAIKKYMKEH
jgi:hypothetical protein